MDGAVTAAEGCIPRTAAARPRTRRRGARPPRSRGRRRWCAAAVGSSVRSAVPASWSPAHGDALDLDARAARQGRDLHGRARGPVRAELLGVDLVHRRELREVGEEDRGLRDAVEAGAGGIEDRGEVVEHAPRLLADVSRDEVTALRVERDLTGAED